MSVEYIIVPECKEVLLQWTLGCMYFFELKFLWIYDQEWEPQIDPEPSKRVDGPCKGPPVGADRNPVNFHWGSQGWVRAFHSPVLLSRTSETPGSGPQKQTLEAKGDRRCCLVTGTANVGHAGCQPVSGTGGRYLNWPWQLSPQAWRQRHNSS